MKLSELKQAVIDLNDGENIDREISLVTAANMALGHINRIIPAEGICSVVQDAPLVGIAGDVPPNMPAVSVTGAAGLSFRARGSGSIKNGDISLRSWTGYGDYRVIRLSLNPTDALSLCFAITSGGVCDFAVYANTLTAERIPEYGAFVRYNLAAYASDIIRPLKMPSTRNGMPVAGAYYKRNTMYVPCRYEGEIEVRYKRAAETVTLEALRNDDDVDITAGLEDVLSLLVSHYLWLEDEPQKADRFLNLFNTHIALARAERSLDGNDRAYSINNW